MQREDDVVEGLGRGEDEQLSNAALQEIGDRIAEPHEQPRQKPQRVPSLLTSAAAVVPSEMLHRGGEGVSDCDSSTGNGEIELKEKPTRNVMAEP